MNGLTLLANPFFGIKTRKRSAAGEKSKVDNVIRFTENAVNYRCFTNSVYSYFWKVCPDEDRRAIGLSLTSFWVEGTKEVFVGKKENKRSY